MILFLFLVQNASDAVNFNWFTTGDYWSTTSFNIRMYWDEIFKDWKTLPQTVISLIYAQNCTLLSLGIFSVAPSDKTMCPEVD